MNPGSVPPLYVLRHSLLAPLYMRSYEICVNGA